MTEPPVGASVWASGSHVCTGHTEEVLLGFTRGRHLKIVGGGHDDDLLVTSGRIVEEMVRFLKTSEIATEKIVLPSL